MRLLHQLQRYRAIIICDHRMHCLYIASLERADQGPSAVKAEHDKRLICAGFLAQPYKTIA